MPFTDSILFASLASIGGIGGVTCALVLRRSRRPFLLTVVVGALASDFLGLLFGILSMVAYYLKAGKPIGAAVMEGAASFPSFLVLAMFLSGPTAILMGAALQFVLQGYDRKQRQRPPPLPTAAK